MFGLKLYASIKNKKNMKQKSKIEETYDYYRQKKEVHEAILQRLKRRIYHIGTIRLLLITGMCVLLWLLREKDWLILTVIACSFLFSFLLLVVYHTILYQKRAVEEGIIRLFINELKALDGDFSAFDGAPEQIDAQHAFSMDLDLFGDRSLFQMINRTVTKMGKETLIDWFLHPLTAKEDILMYQESVREMVNLSGFRHHFYVTGEIDSSEKKEVKFTSPTNDFHRISKNRPAGFLIWFVPAVWVALITGVIIGFIAPGYLAVYLAFSYLLANLPLKLIRNVFISVSKTEKILNTYAKLMELAEQEQFHSTLLQMHQEKLTGRRKLETSASAAIKSLSRTIGALDQRFSLIGIILNLLYLRDTRQAMKLEKWNQKHAGQVKEWFDALGFFDAFCSFGAFAFNHPDYTYPILTDSYFKMEGKALGHPLIHRDQCVCNDVIIPKSKYFLIITGANMAGKSTFLRTVGVNFLFSCMGLPVYAESLAVYPAQLVTSLRTADSLVSNESYFFAELKRLKMIIDRLDAGEELLIILDEILKGTNSADKQKGSFALVKQLISINTCGIIATHDVLLGSLSDLFPEHVQNKRFEADINNDRLTFSYQLRDGIAQNMNASFLMKKMGIIQRHLL